MNVLTLVGFALVTVSGCSLINTYFQKIFRSRDRQLRAVGKDPDQVYLATIGDIQRRQRRRRKDPYTWAVVKYLEWTRRRSARYWRGHGR